ncbi:MAG: hypothetical protein DPW11_03155 [bacterium]|nr:cytochrome b5 domain-containing protein [Candidatus Microgenomates bacterium CPR3]MCQ3944747.1 hypothetical protein [bacterium]RIK50889.1 MAG: hypothetical protein DCC61_04270 [Candidatus Microgenomates bacterium]
MKKISVGVLLVTLAVGVYMLISKKAPTTPYSMDEIAKHSSREDCWMAVEGKVYDVTGYIASGMHKGKDAILMGCGKDATEIYNNRPNGSGAHSKLAREVMVKFAIGVVKQ